MRIPLFAPPIRRIRVTPDDPQGLPERAPRTRRPHGDATVAVVRRLVEQTTLTYGEIAARTGVGRASICRWTRDGGWRRPPFAPRATDTVPRPRASARLKRRLLAARLDALAARYVAELEADSGVDLDKLAAALELAKMAKLAAMGRRRRRSEATSTALSPLVPAKKREARLMQEAGTQTDERHASSAEILAQLRAAGVRLDRAPEAAVKDVIDSHRPPQDDRHLRPRGTKSQRVRAHRRMFDWGRD